MLKTHQITHLIETNYMTCKILSFIPLAICMLSGCGSGSYEMRQQEARQKFERNTSSQQKMLVSQFFSGQIKKGKKFDKVVGGFYCLWKKRSEDIDPHLALNEKFKANGYKITTNKDSLNYIIVSESVSHTVGSYSNGTEAFKLEIVISVIDLKKGLAYTIERAMGTEPSSTIRRRPGNKSTEIGSYVGDEEIYYILTGRITK